MFFGGLNFRPSYLYMLLLDWRPLPLLVAAIPHPRPPFPISALTVERRLLRPRDSKEDGLPDRTKKKKVEERKPLGGRRWRWRQRPSRRGTTACSTAASQGPCTGASFALRPRPRPASRFYRPALRPPQPLTISEAARRCPGPVRRMAALSMRASTPTRNIGPFSAPSAPAHRWTLILPMLSGPASRPRAWTRQGLAKGQRPGRPFQ